ncbi:MAG: potassium channel protein [Deltaproteobacteria bacterium]|nr:MAG: potassium channel protein [Deltaproteobacteria bacterium]RLC18859.1 MAG: potassium channel protein [Deltaproteobacteria bacterium]HHE74271.1 potassium channel protein [Desulfobacteraceae bacterium]
MEIKRRLFYIMFTIFCVILVGSFGYYFIYETQHSFMTCLYMTVVSLTTVGYGEVLEVTGNVPAEIFTMILITFGMGIILYGISTSTAIIIEGELSGVLRKKRMEKKIQKLKDHYIVCGGGQTGRPVLAELILNGEPVVLIEQSEEIIERCKNLWEDLLYVMGDASDDANLKAAGIENAKGVIVSLASDKDNLFTTMSARMLNSRIRIISRVIDTALEAKMRRAGANSIVSPNYIGALRMASEMIRPAAVDFLDSMLRSSRGNLRIHEISIVDKSPLVDKNIIDAGLKQKFDLLVLGIRNNNKEIEFNPDPARILASGETLIVMGEVESITRVRHKY